MKMYKAMLFMVTFGLTWTSFGLTFYHNGQGGGNAVNTSVFGSEFACWTNASTTVAVAAVAGNDYVIDTSGTVQTIAQSGSFQFPGASLSFGLPEKSPGPTVLSKSVMTIDWQTAQPLSCGMKVEKFLWYRGTLKCNTGETKVSADSRKNHATGFSGSAEVFGTDADSHVITPNVSDEYGPRNLCLGFDLKGEPGVSIRHVGLNKLGVEAALGGVRLYLSGDNSQYKGTFSSADWGTVSLLSDTALGDPNTPNAAALTLGSNGGFEVNPSVSPASSRGVTLQDDALGCFVTTHSDSDETRIELPIAGNAAFRKIGGGTIIYAGAYSAGVWTVAEGTLVIAKEAVFPTGQKFIVKAGATLSVAASIEGLSVEREKGGKVEYIVSYDAEAGTATPFDLSTQGDLDLPLSFGLSERIPAEHGDVVRIPIFRLPIDAAVDESDFICNEVALSPAISRTFEISDEGGVKVVYLVEKPVFIVLPETALISGKVSNKQNGDITQSDKFTYENVDYYFWSDHKAAHEDAHYVVTGGQYYVCNNGWANERVFLGDSFNVLGGTITTRALVNRYNRLYAVGGSKFNSVGGGFGENPNRYFGDIILSGSIHSAVEFDGRSAYDAGSGKWALNPVSIEGSVSGEGWIKFTGDAKADYRITSSNPDWKGGVILMYTSTADTNVALRISHADSLGGPLNSFDYRSLNAFADYTGLKPLKTMTLDVANRGLYFWGQGCFIDTPSGVTLTVKQRLRVGNGLVKKGVGTLALGGGIDLGADGVTADDDINSRLDVMEGGLMPIDKGTLAREKLVFHPGAKLVLSAHPTDLDVAQYGLYSSKDTSFQFEDDADLPVEIVDVDAGFSPCRIPVCTVPESAAARIRGKIKLLKPSVGYFGTVEEDVPEAGVVRFAAVYERRGMTLIFR